MARHCRDNVWAGEGQLGSVSGWVLAMTASNFEQRVAAVLGALGIEHHLFCHRIRSVIRGRVVERLRPAFPRYIFVRIVADAMWRKVLEVNSVIGFVKSEEQPIVVPQGVIDDLIARQLNGALPNPLAAKFRLGDRVRIVGEYNLVFGNIGVYQYPIAPDRAVVLLPWFGGASIRTEIDNRDMERVIELRRGRRSGRNKKQRVLVPSHTTDLVAA